MSMPSESDKVLNYWDRSAAGFDAIYTGAKPGWAKALDKSLRRDMYERFDWVIENSGEVRGKSVCDLGCGTGRYVIEYARRGARRVLGVDGAPRMVEKTSELIAQAGLDGSAQVQQYDILNFPEREIFDVTIAVGVFDYTKDASPYLEKIRRVTGARFLSTFPRYWTYRMPIRKVRLGVLGCPVYFYTAEQVQKLHEKAGFICERIEKVGAIYCVSAKAANR
jgi:SAM-dependent methyltransferase